MKVIAGLGNPGAEYANTPHSVGFEVADAVVRAMGATWVSKASFKGAVATGLLAGQRVTVVKPLTFMNLSGDSVAPVLRYSNATAADLIVVSDDIDLPVGKMRLRLGGSAGGHNGLKSVIERVGTPGFVRLRLGVGRDGHDRSNVIGHVLGKFDSASRAVMDEVVSEAEKALEILVSNNIQIAMNRYNGWTAPSAATGKENEK